MHISHWLRAFIADYGYWAVVLALLSESAGIPVPGEITLLLASFLAYSEHQLHLGWIIAVATCAATLGGYLGYAFGYHGGRPLLDRYQSVLRIPPATLQRGENMFARYGAATIFFARFVFGLRVFAGPLAGVLRMRWRTFAFFNFFGAALWVTTIASAGYLFGQHWRNLLRVMQRFNIAVLILAAVVVLFLWRRHRHHPPPENG
ncbi:MAG TPA: DedA family protein [Terriglobales bacterium]|jgi:membrane protein DedA with SNARE-associated domain|nr:DedA family protein [Terriglobales bacterium]